MKKSLLVIRTLLLMFTLINLAMAIFAFVAGDAAVRFIGASYGAAVYLTPQLTHVIRMFGAMNLAMAFLGAMAYLDPVKNRSIINGAILLLSVRAIEMMVFWENIIEHFRVPQDRLIQNIASFSIMAILLFIFRPKAD